MQLLISCINLTNYNTLHVRQVICTTSLGTMWYLYNKQDLYKTYASFVFFSSWCSRLPPCSQWSPVSPSYHLSSSSGVMPRRGAWSPVNQGPLSRRRHPLVAVLDLVWGLRFRMNIFTQFLNNVLSDWILSHQFNNVVALDKTFLQTWSTLTEMYFVLWQRLGTCNTYNKWSEDTIGWRHNIWAFCR